MTHHELVPRRKLGELQARLLVSPGREEAVFCEATGPGIRGRLVVLCDHVILVLSLLPSSFLGNISELEGA